MRTLFTLILALMALSGISKNNDAYLKLCEVNQCWTEQADVAQLQYPLYNSRSEREWIRTHLQLVERILRSRSTTHLSAMQQANRLAALAELNRYWHNGDFPVNDLYSIRTPIFIDRYDNFCAVGYLVKSTGYEHVSRMIAANTNLAYVKQMNYPELDKWADEYGFTKDELAWIQPGYPPSNYAIPVGGGTNGELFEMYVDSADEKLYVGGQFTTVDNGKPAAGIAYITGYNSEFVWHTMGDGLNGKVNAITEFDNKIFAAGNFSQSGGTFLSNVAYWDGIKWNGAGCIGGEVKDMIVFNKELYAVGDFDVCTAMSEVNFAKWNGTVWVGLNSLEGQVNSIHSTGTELILGGKFTHMGNAVNIIKWNPVNGFVNYNNAVKNEVTDIEKGYIFGDLYLSTAGDVDSTQLIMKLDKNNSTWVALPQSAFKTNTERLGLKTLLYTPFYLLAGGDLKYTPQLQPAMVSSNCAMMTGDSLYSWSGIIVDSTINCMALFKRRILLIGGKFDTNAKIGGQQLNSIASGAIQVDVPQVSATERSFSIYPNPAAGSITVKNNFGAKYFKLYDVTGKVVMSREINSGTVTVQLANVTVGSYLAEIADGQGNKAVQKLVIE